MHLSANSAFKTGPSLFSDLFLLLWVNLRRYEGLCSIVYAGLHLLQGILNVVPVHPYMSS